MPIGKYLERFQKRDQLIRLKATGSQKTLASKLRVSERCLYELINEMKELGAPIKYDWVRKSYVYQKKVKFTFQFKEVA